MIVLKTPNGSNPPTRSLTGPKHVKLHKMLQKAPRPCQNPPKIVPKPFQDPPQTLPKSFKNRTRWRVRTVMGFGNLFGRQNGPPNLAKTLQNEGKIRRTSMKNQDKTIPIFSKRFFIDFSRFSTPKSIEFCSNFRCILQ